jgi:hypothetical protein
MTPMRRIRGGRRDLGLGPALMPLARPSLPVVAYRWRYEIAIVSALLAGVAAAWWAGLGPSLAVLAALTATAGIAASIREVRQFAVARAWCVITPHRVRTCFAQAWVQNRAGHIPAVLRTMAQPFGERVLLWCRAGTSFEDIDSTCDLLAAACWATEVVASRSGRYAHLVYLDVIRRPQWQETTDAEPGPAEPDVPPWPSRREGPRRRRLSGMPDNDSRQGAA